MNRFCEDCRHWTRNQQPLRFTTLTPVMDDEPLDGLAVEAVEVAAEPWGDCGRVTSEDRKLRIVAAQPLGSALETRRDFSCQQWQSK